MPPRHLPRRRVLIDLARGAAGLSAAAVLPRTSLAAPTEPERMADRWRVLSRLGYGPTPALIASLDAAPDPRAWALQQIDLAQAASRQPPVLAPELALINAPLPELFEGARAERQARASLKAGVNAPPDAPFNGRFDFDGPPDPLYFNRSMVQRAAAWRLGASSRPDQENALLARLTEFWFNHFNVFSGKGTVRPFAGHYVINVARAHALGRFEDLVLASARHPAMLHYLDQMLSVAEGTPGAYSRGLNENYARELMELHTLGVDGGYTQSDVRELARVLTGWTIDPNAASGFRFAARAHDNGFKTVMGRRYPEHLLAAGVTEGEQAIRWLARQPQTARRVSRRLAQFFVADEPSPTLVAQLAQVFLDSQGDLRLVMRALVEAPEFWKPELRLFKTPMDFASSALTAVQAGSRTLAASLDRRQLALTSGFLIQAGQPVHGWQTPDGYRFDAATWLAPEALTRRADFALALAREQPDLEFLQPFLSATTRATIAKERVPLRPGLVLASPDFMQK